MAKKKQPTAKAKKKTITLREDSQLNQKMIDELEELFLLASPKTLMKSLNYVFFQYLYYGHKEGFPPDFKYIAEDFYLLNKWLEECEDEKNN
jgi:hypothetical protein